MNVTASSGPIGRLIGFAGVAGVRALAAGAGFAATMLVSALLGASGAGLLFSTIAWAGAIAIVLRWGAGERMMIELPRIHGGWRAQAGPAGVNRVLIQMARRYAICAAIILIVWFIADRAGADIPYILPLLLALAPAQALLQIVASVIKSRGDTARGLALEFMIMPASVLIVAGIFWIGMGTMKTGVAAIAYWGGTMLAAGLGVLALAGGWHLRRARRTARRTKLRDNAFVQIELAQFASAYGAVALLPALLSAQDAGAYNIAFRISALSGLVVSTIQAIYVPRWSGFKGKRDILSLFNSLKQAHWLSLVSGVVFAATAIPIGLVVIGILGSSFQSAIEPLVIMVGCQAIALAIGPAGAFVAATDFESYLLKPVLLINGLSFVLIPLFIIIDGLRGAAILAGGTAIVFRMTLLAKERQALREIRARGI
jgi:O-antigen/teichoic acid export membrane protein